jgi:hypothetical protein
MTARLASAFLHALRHPAASRVLIIGHGGSSARPSRPSDPERLYPPLTSRTAESPS